MVWLLGTLAGMGKGAVNATKKSLEFAVDIGEEAVSYTHLTLPTKA